MNIILSDIRNLIEENMEKYIPHVKPKELEENGKVYYMNGKNGTEFDWYVNEHISDFMVFYNDKNNLGAVKLTLYNTGDILLFIYDQKGKKLVKEVTTKIDIEENDILKLAVLLKNEADDKSIWDASIESINSDIEIEKSKINEFKENVKYYTDMINRTKILNLTAYVSKKITEEGWKVGYMERLNPANENDSGWSFMAGNEDEEYASNYKNYELLNIGYVWQQLDQDIFEYITSPVESRYIRISSNEFEEDHGDKEIFVEKR